MTKQTSQANRKMAVGCTRCDWRHHGQRKLLVRQMNRAGGMRCPKCGGNAVSTRFISPTPKSSTPTNPSGGTMTTRSKVQAKASSAAFRNRQTPTADEKSQATATELVYIADRFKVYGLALRQVPAKYGGLAVEIGFHGKRIGTYYATTRRLYSSGQKQTADGLADALRIVVAQFGLKPKPR